jgi:hypothetical protein
MFSREQFKTRTFTYLGFTPPLISLHHPWVAGVHTTMLDINGSDTALQL